ncbi:hypothetical protein B0H16DRAFT_1778679 [Mycena metata]|uniref:Uncharacterized protein n=1 Tax=Mycena metata TaxID=1033252 RepID=A0AAD7HSQ1_9AGAR|nr:hypothetical protein B0H16DRAFT_1778679 [Mycena metata]
MTHLNPMHPLGLVLELLVLKRATTLRKQVSMRDKKKGRRECFRVLPARVAPGMCDRDSAQSENAYQRRSTSSRSILQRTPRIATRKALATAASPRAEPACRAGLTASTPTLTLSHRTTRGPHENVSDAPTRPFYPNGYARQAHTTRARARPRRHPQRQNLLEDLRPRPPEQRLAAPPLRSSRSWTSAQHHGDRHRVRPRGDNLPPPPDSTDPGALPPKTPRTTPSAAYTRLHAPARPQRPAHTTPHRPSRHPVTTSPARRRRRRPTRLEDSGGCPAAADMADHPSPRFDRRQAHLSPTRRSAPPPDSRPRRVTPNAPDNLSRTTRAYVSASRPHSSPASLHPRHTLLPRKINKELAPADSPNAQQTPPPPANTAPPPVPHPEPVLAIVDGRGRGKAGEEWDGVGEGEEAEAAQAGNSVPPAARERRCTRNPARVHAREGRISSRWRMPQARDDKAHAKRRRAYSPSYGWGADTAAAVSIHSTNHLAAGAEGGASCISTQTGSIQPGV